MKSSKLEGVSDFLVVYGLFLSLFGAKKFKECFGEQLLDRLKRCASDMKNWTNVKFMWQLRRMFGVFLASEVLFLGKWDDFIKKFPKTTTSEMPLRLSFYYQKYNDKKN